jgi:hypothetical protein
MKVREICPAIVIFFASAGLAVTYGTSHSKPLGAEEAARIMGGDQARTVNCEAQMTSCANTPANCKFIGGANNWCEQCVPNNYAYCTIGTSPPLPANATCTATYNNQSPVYCGKDWGYSDPTMQCSNSPCGMKQGTCGVQVPNTVTATNNCP